MQQIITAIVKFVTSVLQDPRFIKLVVEKASGAIKVLVQSAGGAKKSMVLNGKMRAV